MPQNDYVSVTIVTYNSGRFIKRCLESVLEQKYDKKEIIVIDNASTDGTMDILEQFEDCCRIVYNPKTSVLPLPRTRRSNCERFLGSYAQSGRSAAAQFHPSPGGCGSDGPGHGTVCGKLLTIKATMELPDQPLVDSTGIYFTPMMRHLDRGSQEVDNGHYRRYEYVFGATAAAALYRREMIDDICIHGEFFDPDFFVYREDADVAWRAQLLGWRCLYTPHALGYHVRNVLPGNRRALPSVINMHSVKNRFLMRLKNMTPDLYRRNWVSITSRDLIVLGCCMVREFTSLKAFWYVARNWRRVLEKRSEIMNRRRVSDEYLASGSPMNPLRSRRQRHRRVLSAAKRQFGGK